MWADASCTVETQVAVSYSATLSQVGVVPIFQPDTIFVLAASLQPQSPTLLEHRPRWQRCMAKGFPESCARFCW